MQLDPLTLMVPAVLATAFAGILLIGAWWFNHRIPALIWWSAANGFNAAGLAVLTAGFAWHSPGLIALGSGINIMSPAMVWGGARSFNDLPARIPVIAAGPVIWLAVALLPFGHDNQKWAAVAAFAAWFSYVSAAVWILWRTRAEKLAARWPLMGFMAAHSIIYLGAGYDAFTGQFPLNQPPPLDSWFGIVHFETIVYAMGTALFMVLVCKERMEAGYIEAARTDPLTGAANRTAFFETAHRLIDRCRREQSPCSLIMFDLDRFKMINDNHGHQVGDRILRDFADTVRLSLRPNDLFGRYGGEEFAVVLPGASIETACVIAERIRQVFADTNKFVDGKPVRATVSAGVAVASPEMTLEAVIGAADMAMYAAKDSGRNRVERASTVSATARVNVVRIA